MAEDQTETEAKTGKKSRKGLIVGLVLAVLAGGGAFYAVYSGLMPGGHGAGHEAGHDDTAEAAEIPAMPDVAFVPLERIVLPVGAGDSGRYLHFAAQIEVPAAEEEEVIHLMPRVTDVLNTYLRAVEPADLSERSALVRLRAQMLRRVQIVLGDGRARDLLITEFVIN